jgi:hypothetical protein
MLLSFYHLVFLGVYSWLFFGVRDHHLLDIPVVFENQESSWGFIDYFLLVGVLTTTTFFLLEFFRYDLEQTHTNKEYMLNLVYTGLLAAVAYPAIQLINNLLPVNLLIVAVGIATGITFIERSRSGSAISRLFWKSVLISVILMIVHAAGSWTAVCLFIPYLLHHLGERAIRLGFNSYSKITTSLYLVANTFYVTMLYTKLPIVGKVLRYRHSKDLEIIDNLIKKHSKKQNK